MSIYSASLFFSFLSSRFLPFHLFCSHIWVSRLYFARPLFLLLSWPLISCFLLSILTQDWSPPPAQLSALEELTANIDEHGHHIFLYISNPAAFCYSFSAQENDRQALWLFTLSESQCSVTSNRFRLALLHAEVWVKAYDASLRVMWH